MAIAKRVVLSQIEIVPNGTVQVRLEKQVVDGDAVIAREYHRTAIPLDVRSDDQMALVSEHLASMGWPPVDSDVLDHVRRIAQVERVVARH